MGVLVILSAKGGSGASLLATNLGICLSRRSSTLLIDLHDITGSDDLLLNACQRKAWIDLIQVANELVDQHLTSTIRALPSGLHFLGCQLTSQTIHDQNAITNLLGGLSKRYQWVVVDCPCGLHPFTLAALAAA